MHVPGLFPLLVIVLLPFAIVWIWPRRWVAVAVTVALLAFVIGAYMSIVAPIYADDPNSDALIRAGLFENAIKIAVMSAIMFAIVAWRGRKKATPQA